MPLGISSGVQSERMRKWQFCIACMAILLALCRNGKAGAGSSDFILRILSLTASPNAGILTSKGSRLQMQIDRTSTMTEVCSTHWSCIRTLNVLPQHVICHPAELVKVILIPNKWVCDQDSTKSSVPNAESRTCSGTAAHPVHAKSLELLGIEASQSLTSARLREAFRACALAWHPDRHVGAEKHAAEAKFKEAQAAYTLLRSLCVG